MRVGENYCPGILHPVPAKDGMLMRMRVPGGLISAHQLGTVASLSKDFADGQVEITSRANLQLRAIQARNLPAIVEALSAMDFLPSREHDRVRNIATNPLTGLVPEEVIDTRSLVRELDRRLIVDERLVELHPKFSFGIYGGGTLFSHEPDDLALHTHEHSGLFQIFIGRLDTGYAVPFDGAVDCLLDAARLCIKLAQQNGLLIRGRKLISVPGLIETIIEVLSPSLLRSPGYEVPAVITLAPIGFHPAIDASKRNIIPAVVLGRLTSKQAKLFAQLAAEHSGDLRLAPWRGIVLGAVALECVADVVAHLEAAGLNLDERDGFHGMAACAGTTGCDASLADVRGDAQRIALRLSGRSPVPRWTINLSGCEKQCAMRHGAMAELVGTASGYLLRLKGHPLPETCLPDDAIDLVVAAHNALHSEVAPS
jgi:precorrin-3B synthase